ncbi:MAG TPA: hypothetical protein VMV47_14240 [Bacteroidales bacterium]|nr:hypothetical protein [Bacteroidales bacterium]
MKTTLKIAVVLILLSGTAFFVSGQTLKERIDHSVEIKVYFRNSDIEHNPNTLGNPEMSKQGTNCEKFRETTPLPSEYIDAVRQITGMLNKGFNTTVFTEGDLTYLSSLPVNSKGELDWLRLGEPLTFFVSSSGHYSVNKFPNTGKENTMEVQSYLYVYSITDGKFKTLSTTVLAWKQTQPIKTPNCDDYDWFVKNIPPASLAEPFKALVTDNILKFIDKELSAYEKAMKKKK